MKGEYSSAKYTMRKYETLKKLSELKVSYKKKFKLIELVSDCRNLATSVADFAILLCVNSEISALVPVPTYISPY